jgi:ketosteroid isomerase-like protein
MMNLRSLAGAALSVLVLIVAVARMPAAHARGGRAVDEQALIAQLQATTADWNKGDLEAFVAPYDASSTFMTKQGPIGRDAMKAHYKDVFFGAEAKPRPLRFERVTVRPLGDDNALMTGHFVLGGDGKPDQAGWFTLVWTRTPQGWRILHDHSS